MSRGHRGLEPMGVGTGAPRTVVCVRAGMVTRGMA